MAFKTSRALLTGLLISSACPPVSLGQDIHWREENCLAVPGHASVGRICIEADADGSMPAWQLMDKKGNRLQRSDRPWIGDAFYQMIPSPSGKLIAVIGAEEGHPVLHIVDAEKLLEPDAEPMIFASGIYPGGIALRHWQQEQLILESDQDLLQGWHRTDYPDFFGCFRLEPRTARLEAVSCPD